MTADGYTKGLIKTKFKFFIELLSLKDFQNIIIYIAVNLRIIL
jgi:hypothetical protein